jgi:hypothetical protein
MRITRWMALGLAGLAACGYSTGLTLPQGRHSVAVAIFGNDSKLRDLEQDLNYELGAAAERLIDARLARPDQADVVIRGRILQYDRRGGIRSNTNILLESGIQITVEAQLEWRADADAEAPEGSRPKARFISQSGFRLDEAGGEHQARQRVLRSLSEQMVLDLFAPLAYEAPPQNGNGPEGFDE